MGGAVSQGDDIANELARLLVGITQTEPVRCVLHAGPEFGVYRSDFIASSPGYYRAEPGPGGVMRIVREADR